MASPSLISFLGLDAQQFLATFGQVRAQAQGLASQMQTSIGHGVLALDDMHSRYQKLTPLLMTVGVAFTAMGAASAAAVALTAKAAIDYERAFAGVRKTVEGTEPELNKINQAFRDMAKILPVTVEELARIGETAGSMGISGVRDVTKFTEIVAKMGATTNLTSEAAATAFAQIANVMQEPIVNVDRMAASIVAVGQKLVTTERQVTEFTVRVAGAGKIAGLSTAEIIGISGAFASVGIEAELGGTAIQRVLTEMTKAVTTGSGELSVFAKIVGTTREGFQELFNTKPAEAFTQVVEGLGAAGKQAIPVFEALGLDGQRTFLAFQNMANAGDLLRRSIEISTVAWTDNNALQKAFDERSKTTYAQLTILSNRFNDLAITIGNTMLPAIRLGADSLGVLINLINTIPGIGYFVAGSAAVAAVIFTVLGAATLAAASLLALHAGLDLVGMGMLSVAAKATAVSLFTSALTGLGIAIRGILGLMLGPVGWVAFGLSLALLVDQGANGGAGIKALVRELDSFFDWVVGKGKTVADYVAGLLTNGSKFVAPEGTSRRWTTGVGGAVDPAMIDSPGMRGANTKGFDPFDTNVTGTMPPRNLDILTPEQVQKEESALALSLMNRMNYLAKRERATQMSIQLTTRDEMDVFDAQEARLKAMAGLIESHYGATVALAQKSGKDVFTMTAKADKERAQSLAANDASLDGIAMQRLQLTQRRSQIASDFQVEVFKRERESEEAFLKESSTAHAEHTLALAQFQVTQTTNVRDGEVARTAAMEASLFKERKDRQDALEKQGFNESAIRLLLDDLDKQQNLKRVTRGQESANALHQIWVTEAQAFEALTVTERQSFERNIFNAITKVTDFLANAGEASWESYGAAMGAAIGKIAGMDKLENELRIQVASLGKVGSAALEAQLRVKLMTKEVIDRGPDAVSAVEKVIAEYVRMQKELDKTRTKSNLLYKGMSEDVADHIATVLSAARQHNRATDEATRDLEEYNRRDQTLFESSSRNTAEMQRLKGDFFGFLGTHLKLAASQETDLWDESKKLVTTFVGEAQSTLSAGLFEFFKTGTLDAAKLFGGFVDSMLKAVTDFLAKQAIQAILKFAQPLIASLAGQIGTGIQGIMGKAKGGFGDEPGPIGAGDVIPTLLGRDELVLNPEQVSFLQRLIGGGESINAMGETRTLFSSETLGRLFPGYADVGMNYGLGGGGGDGVIAALFGLSPQQLDAARDAAGMGGFFGDASQGSAGLIGSGGIEGNVGSIAGLSVAALGLLLGALSDSKEAKMAGTVIALSAPYISAAVQGAYAASVAGTSIATGAMEGAADVGLGGGGWGGYIAAALAAWNISQIAMNPNLTDEEKAFESLGQAGIAVSAWYAGPIGAFLATLMHEYVSKPIFYDLLGFGPSKRWASFGGRLGETLNLEQASANGLSDQLMRIGGYANTSNRNRTLPDLAASIQGFEDSVGARIGGFGQGNGPFDIAYLPGAGGSKHEGGQVADFGPMVDSLQTAVDRILGIYGGSHTNIPKYHRGGRIGERVILAQDEEFMVQRNVAQQYPNELDTLNTTGRWPGGGKGNTYYIDVRVAAGTPRETARSIVREMRDELDRLDDRTYSTPGVRGG